MGDELLAVDVISARDDLLILQTTWAPADRLRFGRRQSRSAIRSVLLRRLTELVPLIAGHLRETAAPIGHDLRAAAA